MGWIPTAIQDLHRIPTVRYSQFRQSKFRVLTFPTLSGQCLYYIHECGNHYFTNTSKINSSCSITRTIMYLSTAWHERTLFCIGITSATSRSITINSDSSWKVNKFTAKTEIFLYLKVQSLFNFHTLSAHQNFTSHFVAPVDHLIEKGTRNKIIIRYINIPDT